MERYSQGYDQKRKLFRRLCVERLLAFHWDIGNIV